MCVLSYYVFVYLYMHSCVRSFLVCELAGVVVFVCVYGFAAYMKTCLGTHSAFRSDVSTPGCLALDRRRVPSQRNSSCKQRAHSCMMGHARAFAHVFLVCLLRLGHAAIGFVPHRMLACFSYSLSGYS